MNKEQTFGIIRHTLTFVGGILVTKGLIGENELEVLTSSIITLTGLIWSIIIKNK